MNDVVQELVFVEPGRLAWRERRAPRIETPVQALVRPLAVARCDLDWPIVAGQFPIAGPFAIGHEFVAEVIEIGEAVTTVAPGDRVCVPFQISCGTCDRCRHAFTGSCRTAGFLSAFGLAPLSGTEWGGALTDAVRVPFADAMLIRAPDNVPLFALAAASDNIVDGYRGVAGPLALAQGAPVLIAGGAAASVGLYAVAAARALGACEVTYVDDGPERLAIATQLGARVVEATPEPRLRVGRFPITVEACGTPAALQFALASTDLEGTCTSLAIQVGSVNLPLFELYTRGIRFNTGRVHARALLPEVLDLLARDKLSVAPVVTRRAAWEDVVEAWGEPATKLVIERPLRPTPSLTAAAIG